MEKIGREYCDRFRPGTAIHGILSHHFPLYSPDLCTSPGTMENGYLRGQPLVLEGPGNGKK